MLQSMTGFGRADASSPSKKIIVEIKTLNSKQLDLQMRVPSCFREQEVTLRSLLQEKLHRGKVDVVVTMENLTDEAPLMLNMGAIRTYKAEIDTMICELALPEPADWTSTLLRLPDAMKAEQTALSPEDIEALRQALLAAIDGVVEFREQEGQKLAVFFREKISRIGELLAEVEPFEANRIPKIRKRLEDQLERLDNIEYDAGRLEQELIFYIEKLDITEEKTRLRAHLNYFLETMDGAGEGKKLGFIAQEMGREINTLGSKANDAEMQKIVVKMKDELEQIKEQVLNVL